MRGTLVGHIWHRNPSLELVETKEHKTIPGLYFEIGRDPSGNHEIRRVIYPLTWTTQQIYEAVNSADPKLESGDCPHCRQYNDKALQTITTPKKKTPRILPRPIRDRISEYLAE